MQAPVIFVALGILILGGIFILVRHFDRKRLEALEAVARGLDLRFQLKDTDKTHKNLEQFHLFSQGHGKRLSSIMRGSAQGIELMICDYRYTVGGGKNSHTYRQTVVLFSSERLNLPGFTLRPQNFFHKIGKAFGYSDIDFDSYPDFSGRYLLRGENENAVRMIFKNPVIKFFEGSDKLCCEGIGDQLLVYRGGKRVKPELIDDFLGQGFEVFGLLGRQDG